MLARAREEQRAALSSVCANEAAGASSLVPFSALGGNCTSREPAKKKPLFRTASIRDAEFPLVVLPTPVEPFSWDTGKTRKRRRACSSSDDAPEAAQDAAIRKAADAAKALVSLLRNETRGTGFVPSPFLAITEFRGIEKKYAIPSGESASASSQERAPAAASREASPEFGWREIFMMVFVIIKAGLKEEAYTSLARYVLQQALPRQSRQSASSGQSVSVASSAKSDGPARPESTPDSPDENKAVGAGPPSEKALALPSAQKKGAENCQLKDAASAEGGASSKKRSKKKGLLRCPTCGGKKHARSACPIRNRLLDSLPGLRGACWQCFERGHHSAECTKSNGPFWDSAQWPLVLKLSSCKADSEDGPSSQANKSSLPLAGLGAASAT